MANKLNMTAEFLGADALLKALAAGTPLAKKIGRKAFAKFGRETRDDMRAHAPEGETKKLKKSIKSKETRGGGVKVYGDRRIAPHTHFRDAGTKERKTKRGANRGKVVGTHWIENAQARAKARFQSNVADPLLKELASKLKGSLPHV